jgi:3-hydroxymyristoyl/3-hydroxydecanoyl-(acyl carrier protein) dehydratase
MRTDRIEIPLRHPVFDGHFPNRPLVPGSLLLELILVAWGGPVTGVRSAKFFRPVIPGDVLTLSFAPVAGGSAIRFDCMRGTQTVCAGTLVGEAA